MHIIVVNRSVSQYIVHNYLYEGLVKVDGGGEVMRLSRT